MNEIIVSTVPAKIEMNFEELEIAIDNKLSEYQGIIVTEEFLKEAKSEIASLRKDVKVIDDKRKEIKSEILKTYEEIEPKFKILISKYNSVIDLMDLQAKEFEEKRKQRKREKIAEYFNSVCDIFEYLSITDIYNPKWENASMSFSSVQEEISESIRKVQADLQSIKLMNSEAEEQALSEYKRTRDLSAAINKITEYESNKRIILEKQREAELERARQEERNRMLEEQRIIEQAKAEAREEIKAEVIEEVKAEIEAEVKPMQIEESFEAPEETKSYIITATPQTLFYRFSQT